MKSIVAGKDVSFGRGKAGNAEFLDAHAAEYGYTVDLIDKIKVDECENSENADRIAQAEALHLQDGSFIDISSTLLRECIKKGDMDLAERILGSAYALSGIVVHGKGLAGSKMKYPTMNIEVSDDLTLPPFGVYAVKTIIYDGYKKDKSGQLIPIFRTVNGIANLGERPTVNGSVEGGSRLRLEVHAFEDIGDCYDKKVKVEFCKFIRAEKKFDSVEELTAWIFEHDVPETEEYFRK